MNWRHQAACRTETPDLFFSAGSGGSAQAQVARAKQVCAGCTVRDECLQWALQVGVDDGVWGGLTTDERRLLKRRTARRRHREAKPASTGGLQTRHS